MSQERKVLWYEKLPLVGEVIRKRKVAKEAEAASRKAEADVFQARLRELNKRQEGK